MSKGQPTPYYANPTTIPQAQAPYNQYPQGGSTVIITASPQAIPRYGTHSQHTICPHCHKTIFTRIETASTSRTHLMAILCCIFCCLPCLPYCIDSCKNKNHFCPSCSAYLGTYSSDTLGYSGYPY